MGKRNGVGSEGHEPDLDRRIRQAIQERFADGKWRTLEEMAAALSDVIPEEAALAAYEEGMEEGRRYGRRWAATAPAKELARVVRCHDAWRGDWWGWAERGGRALTAARRFYRLVRPGTGSSGALAWWAGVLGNPDPVDVLECGEGILVVGFAEGAVEHVRGHASAAE